MTRDEVELRGAIESADWRFHTANKLQGRRTLGRVRVGEDVHELIGDLLISKVDLDSPLEIASFVARRIRAGSVSHRQSRRTLVSPKVVRYFGLFQRSDAWTFLGAEVSLDDVRLDLLWVGPGGRVEADEVKSGSGYFGEAELSSQIHSQMEAGLSTFGSKFGGVRAVILGRAPKSFLFTPSEIQSID